MKKTRKVVVMDAEPYPLYEIPKIKDKHQCLLQDYEELQNETEAMKEKLLIAKQRKSTLLAEVRFLRHRYEFLKNQSSNPHPKHGLKLPQNIETRAIDFKEYKIYRNREATLNPLAQAYDLNQREGINNGMETASRKSRSSRICYENEATLNNSSSIFDQKGRVYREQEAASNINKMPVFDLNQISREEEEQQAIFEPLKMEETKRGLPRNGSDLKNNDMKISVCRNVGNGVNRAGKRKLSWQDQVALRA